jgi:hypothetical protein
MAKGKRERAEGRGQRAEGRREKAAAMLEPIGPNLPGTAIPKSASPAV